MFYYWKNYNNLSVIMGQGKANGITNPWCHWYVAIGIVLLVLALSAFALSVYYGAFYNHDNENVTTKPPAPVGQRRLGKFGFNVV